MDIVQEYLKNLKRFDDAARYFESLDSVEGIENTKEYKAFLQIYKNCCKLYPLAKAQGCNKVFYY